MAIRTAAERAELPTICKIHDVPFVKFSGTGWYADKYSFGCELCVKKIRDQVRKERALARTRRGRRPKTSECVPVATSERWPR